MKALIVFDSTYGNTKKVADAIAKELGTEAIRVDKVTEKGLKGVDLLVIGAPIIGWRPSQAMGQFLASLPQLEGVRAAAFDTRMNVWYSGDAVKKMAKSLSDAKAVVVGTEKFIVKDKEGPLAEGELERAGKWAKTLI